MTSPGADGETLAGRDTVRLPRSRRLVGVDAARGLALLGMMAAHLLAHGSPAHALVDGRSSATFAVLAGVGLALADGGADGPRTPYRHMVARVAVRAAVILLVGLVLTDLGPPVAVILQYYALSFLLLAPALRLPPLVLGLGGLAWLGLAPLLSHVVRGAAGLTGPGPQVGLTRLVVQPVGGVLDLLLTGYYPVLAWFGYLLLGAAVGRLSLRSTRQVLLVGLTGLVLVVGAALASAAVLARPGAQAALAGPDPDTLRRADGSFYGTTPTASWWWLGLDAPHSGTPPDLLGTAGSALLLLALCLLLARTVGAWGLLPLAAAGSMTLTLYSLHVVSVLGGLPTSGGAVVWAAQAAVALALAMLWRAQFARGPFEAATAALVDAVAGPPPPRRRETPG